MNPLFTAAINAIIRRKRTCRKCGSSQIVPAEKKGKTVICKACGAEIPPRVK